MTEKKIIIRNNRKAKIPYDKARKADKDGSNKDFLKLDPTTLNRCKSFSVAKHVAVHKEDALLLGIELELEASPTYNRLNTLTLINSYFPNKIRCVSDGSLNYDYGIEINTLPLAELEFNQDRITWYRMLSHLSRVGSTSHNNDKCGLHVHINRKYLPYETWRKIEKFIIRHKKGFETISRRREFHFCKMHYSGELGRINTYDGSDTRRSNERYSAVNITRNTVEFRFFRGTLLPQSFLASIESILLLVKYFKEENPKRISFRSFSTWILFQTSCPFGRILLGSITPEIVKRTPLTAEQREERRNVILHNRERRIEDLNTEMERLIYGCRSATIPQLWVYRELMHEYRCGHNGTQIEQIEIPVKFVGNIKKAIREAAKTIRINILRPASAPIPEYLNVRKSNGWGHVNMYRSLCSDSTTYTSPYRHSLNYTQVS